MSATEDVSLIVTRLIERADAHDRRMNEFSLQLSTFAGEVKSQLAKLGDSFAERSQINITPILTGCGLVFTVVTVLSTAFFYTLNSQIVRNSSDIQLVVAGVVPRKEFDASLALRDRGLEDLQRQIASAQDRIAMLESKLYVKP